MSRPLSILIAALLVTAAASPVAALTEGEPGIVVFLPDNYVSAGEGTTLQLFLTNEGTIDNEGPADHEALVATAQNLTVSMGSGDAPIEVRTATRPVGDVPEGQVGPLAFTVAVDEDADPGTYRLPVTLRYHHASEVEDDGDTDRSDVEETHFVTIVVDANARFAALNATADVAVGQRGSVSLTLENAATFAVSEARVTVRSTDPSLTVGGASSASVFAGTWAPGAVRTFTIDAAVVPGADVRAYPLTVVVAYRAPDGDQEEATPVSVGVTPRADQSFALADVTSSLAVGDEGTVRGTVTNAGAMPVRNAVVVFSAGNVNIVPGETEYALGDLDPGRSATFAFDAEVADSADAGPRQISFVVRYRDGADDVHRSDPLDARVEVGPRQAEFAVERVSGPARAGETGVLVLRVSNAGEEPLTDISAKLFTDDPLSSTDDEAFIDRLTPGASQRIEFALGVSPDALAKAYPVSLDFQYDDADGETRLSDTYRVAVAVSASDDRGLLPMAWPYALGGVALLGLLVVAGLWYRRR